MISKTIAPDALLERFEELHRRLLAGDTEAGDEIVQLMAVPIRSRLRRRFCQEELHVLDTAFDDALLKYLREPARYRKGRGHPLAWLTAIAANAVIDDQRLRTRRAEVERPRGVDLSSLAASQPSSERNDGTWLRDARAALSRAARSEQDLAFIGAKLAGAAIRVQAAIIRVDHLPVPQQIVAVRRRWKCLLRRLERLRSRP